MKQLFLIVLIFSLFCTYGYSQTPLHLYHGIPDRHLIPYTFKPQTQLGADTFPITLNYDSADAELYSSVYIHNQGQLMNMHYSFPADTNGSYKSKTIFGQNYYCINYAMVAFDSLYDPYTFQTINSNRINGLGLDTIFVPLVQVNHSGIKDTLELQLNTVDGHGYPTSSYILDTMIINDTIGYGNNYQIKLLKWKLGLYKITGSKFAITIKYYGSKKDSCWFIYGYSNFTKSCPYQKGIITFANPTHFSKVGSPSFTANSFALWNSEAGNGIMPQSNGNNNFFPCDSTDFTFHPGIDGANYLQNINIFVSLYVYITTGIVSINNPLKAVQNFPNPFSQTSNLTFTLSQRGNVSLKINDITGRELINKSYGLLGSGNHSLLIDGSNFVQGVYFYVINVDGNSLTGKMVIAR